MAANTTTRMPAMREVETDFRPVADLDHSTLVKSLAQMWIIRRFEEKAAQIYTMGKIGGFCHLCIGQEAIAVGASLAMQPQDTIITAYRAHGFALARGLTPVQVMGELMGKAVGCSKGKGGSMHMFHKERGFYGGHGIVGAQTSLGTGLGFAHKYRQDGGVCLAFLGDGASNQGQFYESMNMASLWNLPVLYVIENNQYGMGTSVARACAGGPLQSRGESFEVAGYRVLGDDLIQVYKTFVAMMNHIRTTGRPLLLEIDTYRFRGHSMSDPGKYRTRQELDQARQSRDPLDRLGSFLIQEQGLDPDTLKHIDQCAKDEVEQAFQICDHASEPDLSEIWTDILVACDAGADLQSAGV